MAYASIKFESPRHMAIYNAPVGFSWTVLFFGAVPPLLRGHYAAGYVIGAWQLVTLGLSNIIFAFIYNRLFILHIMGEGLKASGASHDLNHLSVRLKFRIPELEKTQPENTRMQRYPLPKQRPGAMAV